jgi:hypothetical protein
MNLNDLIPIILLIIAIADTILIKYVFPSIFAKNKAIQPQHKINQQKMLKSLNVSIYIFVVAAVIIYFARPF